MTESLAKKVQQIDTSLRMLRKRLAEQDNDHRRDLTGLRFGVAASALAGTLFALTAAVWGAEESRYGDEVLTLWSLVAEGWFGFVTLVLVVVAGIGTLAAVVAATWGGHITAVVLCLLAAIAALAVSGSAEAEEATGPGRWLTVIVALALAMMHGARAGDLRKTR